MPCLPGVLKDEGDPKDQAWLKERLSIAAGKRYQRLHRNTVKRITENGDICYVVSVLPFLLFLKSDSRKQNDGAIVTLRVSSKPLNKESLTA
jgi:hypothetical protein